MVSLLSRRPLFFFPCLTGNRQRCESFTGLSDHCVPGPPSPFSTNGPTTSPPILLPLILVVIFEIRLPVGVFVVFPCGWRIALHLPPFFSPPPSRTSVTWIAAMAPRQVSFFFHSNSALMPLQLTSLLLSAQPLKSWTTPSLPQFLGSNSMGRRLVPIGSRTHPLDPLTAPTKYSCVELSNGAFTAWLLP